MVYFKKDTERGEGMDVIRLKLEENQFLITERTPFAIAVIDQIYDGDVHLALDDLKGSSIEADLLMIRSITEHFDNIVIPENYAPIEYQEYIQYLNECKLTFASFKRGTFSGFQDKIMAIADRGDYEGAQNFLDLLLNANVDHATVSELKGSIYLESGDEEKGIEWLKRALEIDPSLISPYSFLGQTFYNRGEFGKAASYWEREIMAAPDHIVTYFMLTDAYMNAGRMDDAMSVLKCLSERDPSSILTKAEMLDLYERSNNSEMASRIEGEILDAVPVYTNDVEAWAKIQFKYGNFKVVEEVAGNFLRTDPDRPELKMLLVVTSIKCGLCERAKKLLKEFENEEMWYFYGKKELFSQFLTEEERASCGIL
jgi:tetratricopeptide (TPR) repeat protein